MASVILSGTTVLAYAPMQTSEVSDTSIITEEFATFDTGENLKGLFSNSNIYFETLDGRIISVNDSDVEPRAILCSHNFESGYANVHQSKSDGGCIMKRYTAKICKKCNHLVIMDYVSTTTYAKCPH